MADLFDGTPDERPPDPRGEWNMAAWQFGLLEGTWLEIRFECLECGDFVYSEDFQVPGLNLAAEKSRDLAVTDEFSAHCDSCGADYELYVESEPGGAHVDSYTGDVTHMTCEHRVTSPAPEYLDDYFEDYLDAVTSNTEFYQTFEDGLHGVRQLAERVDGLPSHLADALARMLYANVITLLETYLSDALVNTTMSDEGRVKQAVRKLRHFREQKIPLSAVLDRAGTVGEDVKRYLVSVLYHDLDAVTELYGVVLGVELPTVPEVLTKAIGVRHDVVHRNGKDKEGGDINIEAENVLNLADVAEGFVSELDGKINKLNEREPPESAP